MIMVIYIDRAWTLFLQKKNQRKPILKTSFHLLMLSTDPHNSICRSNNKLINDQKPILFNAYVF